MLPKSLNIAIDTNIIFGLINEEDRLHRASLKLIKHVDNLLLFHTVLFETLTTFPKKALDVLRECMQYVLYSKELDKEALLKRLIQKKPKYENFIKYVVKRISELWKRYNDPYAVFIELGRIFGEFSDGRTIIEIIARRLNDAGVNLESIKICGIDRRDPNELKTCEDVINILKDNDISFRDDYDRDIFVEVVVYANRVSENFIFVSDDEEFIKKAKRGIGLLDFLNVKNLRLCLLKDIIELLPRD